MPVLDDEQLRGRVGVGENRTGEVESEIVDTRRGSEGCLCRSGNFDCDAHNLGVAVAVAGMGVDAEFGMSR